jgi:hypothetical protein
MALVESVAPARKPRASRSPYYFNRDMARYGVDFFRRFLRLPSAEWYGRPFELNKEQRGHVANIFLAGGAGVTARGAISACAIGNRNATASRCCGPAWAIASRLPTMSRWPRFIRSRAIMRKPRSLSITPRSWLSLDIDKRGTRGPLASLYEVNKEALFCPHLLSTFHAACPAIRKASTGCRLTRILGDEIWEWRNGRAASSSAEKPRLAIPAG